LSETSGRPQIQPFQMFLVSVKALRAAATQRRECHTQAIGQSAGGTLEPRERSGEVLLDGRQVGAMGISREMRRHVRRAENRFEHLRRVPPRIGGNGVIGGHLAGRPCGCEQLLLEGRMR